MKTIYLLCGLLSDDVVWKAQAAALAPDYDVRIVSFTNGEDTITAMAERVLASAAESAPARFALAGHSMGGRVALEVLRRAPDRVERLALLDTGFEAALPAETAKRGALVDQARREGIASIAAAWGLPMLAPARRDDPALVRQVFDMVARMSPEIYAAQTRALLTRPDATEVLRSVACPTLILCGRQDGWSPPERHERMAELLPQPPLLRFIDDCGHMSMMEQPDAVLAAMRAWLEEGAR